MCLGDNGLGAGLSLRDNDIGSAAGSCTNRLGVALSLGASVTNLGFNALDVGLEGSNAFFACRLLGVALAVEGVPLLIKRAEELGSTFLNGPHGFERLAPSRLKRFRQVTLNRGDKLGKPSAPLRF